MSDLKKKTPPWITPWLLAAAATILVASTASHYGVTWDEPPYFHAADLHIRWLVDFSRQIFSGQAKTVLQDDAISQAWHWNPYRVPHPPFSRILSGLSKSIFSPLIDTRSAYRLPSAAFLGLLVALMYVWMSHLFDPKTGLVSAATLLLMPNLFGQAHFAMTDMPLTALWFVTAYGFWRGLKDWRWSVLAAVIWGFALATKFPAFLIPIPLLLWAHLYHRRAYGNNVIAMMFIGPMIMVACNPYFWHQTLPRIVTFLYDSVSRAYRPETNFAVYFYGQLLRSSELPWYYPFFMIGITIPEAILILFLIGALATAWNSHKQEVMVLFLANALFIPSTGLLPGAVLHDVNRLMLPALPFLAGLAGFGFLVSGQWLIQKMEGLALPGRIQKQRHKLIGALALLVIAPSAVDMITYHPYELSYYNRLVGGIRGAYERGLEVTYLMESFTPGFLQHLNAKLPPNATLNASSSNFMFRYYQQEGLLRPDLKITDSRDFDYYILLNRVSTFSDGDRAFLATDPMVHDAWRFDGVPFIYILRPRQ